MLEKENFTFKDDALNANESLKRARAEALEAEERVNKVQLSLMEAESKAGEDKDAMTKLRDRIDDLLDKLKKSEFENVNLKDDL